MLHLILGRQGTGKTDTIYKQIRKNLDAGEEKLVLIVPEQFTLQAERELVEKLDTPGIMHVEVLSFSRLANRILEENGVINYSKISQTGKYMILQKSLIELKDQLYAYKGMVDKEGFVSELEEFISNLKRRMITDEQLRTAADNPKIKDSMLCAKIDDLGMIYESYNSWMDDYFDNEEALNKVIQLIDNSEFISGTKFWIDGFHTFTEQHYCLIEKFITYASELTISITQCLPKDRDIDNFQINRKTQLKLIELANGNYDSIRCSYEADKSNEIKHLERELYSYPPKEYTKPIVDIKIRYYKNIYDELDGLCIEILKLIQGGNYRWRDIKVATNDLDTYSFPIKRTFEEYEIPFFMDEKRKISDKPLSILLIDTLKVISYNYRYEDVFSLIKTGLTDVEYDEYELLENYVLKYGIKGKQWEREFTYINENDELDLDKVNETRESIIKPILELKDMIKKDLSFKSISHSLFSYLSVLNVESKLKENIQELKEDYTQYEYASEISQIYNIIVDLLDEIVEIFQDKETSVLEYMRILKAGIESVDLAIIPSALDQVMVGDITRSRNTEYKVLFVIGANEGKFPSSPSTKGLLNEYENKLMRENGLEVDDDISYKSIQENYLIYNQISKSSDKVYMFYPLADFEGSSLRPSILIDTIKELFVNIQVEKGDVNTVDAITTGKGTLKHLINHIQSTIDGAPSESIWDEVYKWYSANPQWTENIEQIKDAILFDNQVEPLSKSKGRELYGDTIRTSVTRLEEYSNCPFKHFITFGLRPRERKVYEISIPDVGEILHQLIYEFSLKVEIMGLNWSDLDQTQVDSICQEVINGFLAEYRRGILLEDPRYYRITRYVSRTFIRAVNVLIYHYSKGKFQVAGNELIFGIDGELQPIKIEISDEYIMYLEGRIDRVDILQEGKKTLIKVLDFKTGNKELSLQDIYYGLSLQLLVYTWVCLNYGKSKDLDVTAAGMFYLKLHDPLIPCSYKDESKIEREIHKKLRLNGLMLKDAEVFKAIDENTNNSDILNYKINKDGSFRANSKCLVTEGQLDQLIDYAERKITDIGLEIFNGNISISPTKIKDKQACDYCNYKSICFFDRQLTSDKISYKRELDEEQIFDLIGKADKVEEERKF